MSFPFGIGGKYGLDNKWSIGLEIGLHYTLSDYIDDVSGVYYDKKLIRQYKGDIAAYLSAALENDGPEEASRQRAQARLSQLLAESVDHAYRLSRGLWSLGPESSDIGQALSTLARTQSEASGIPIELTLNPACAQCSATHAPQIYGIAREAVVNAIKHARPQRIDIALDCRPGREEKAIVLCVRDDGCGRAQGRVPADEDAPGLGLRIMSHRAQMVGGEFHIDDAPGGGTRITCRIPCQPQPEHAAAPNPAA